MPYSDPSRRRAAGRERARRSRDRHKDRPAYRARRADYQRAYVERHDGEPVRRWNAGRSPEYVSWSLAKQRVTNPNTAHWANYGGRGIDMDPRWLASFDAFLADMGPRPEGTSLDRIENDRGYWPDNCRWATPAEQARNRRPRRPSSVTAQSGSADSTTHPLREASSSAVGSQAGPPIE